MWKRIALCLLLVPLITKCQIINRSPHFVPGSGDMSRFSLSENTAVGSPVYQLRGKIYANHIFFNKNTFVYKILVLLHKLLYCNWTNCCDKDKLVLIRILIYILHWKNFVADHLNFKVFNLVKIIVKHFF